MLQIRSEPVALGKWGLYMPPVTTALYNRDILRLAVSIPHHARLPHPQASVERRSPVCGSWIAIDVVLDEEGRVAGLGQDVKACALGQASASLLGANAIGRNGTELAAARDALAAFLQGEREDPGDWPGLSVFSGARPFKARHKSILLAFEAAAEAADLALLAPSASGRD